MLSRSRHCSGKCSWLLGSAARMGEHNWSHRQRNAYINPPIPFNHGQSGMPEAGYAVGHAVHHPMAVQGMGPPMNHQVGFPQASPIWQVPFFHHPVEFRQVDPTIQAQVQAQVQEALATTVMPAPEPHGGTIPEQYVAYLLKELKLKDEHIAQLRGEDSPPELSGSTFKHHDDLHGDDEMHKNEEAPHGRASDFPSLPEHLYENNDGQSCIIAGPATERVKDEHQTTICSHPTPPLELNPEDRPRPTERCRALGPPRPRRGRGHTNGKRVTHPSDQSEHAEVKDPRLERFTPRLQFGTIGDPLSPQDRTPMQKPSTNRTSHATEGNAENCIHVPYWQDRTVLQQDIGGTPGSPASMESTHTPITLKEPEEPQFHLQTSNLPVSRPGTSGDTAETAKPPAASRQADTINAEWYTAISNPDPIESASAQDSEAHLVHEDSKRQFITKLQIAHRKFCQRNSELHSSRKQESLGTSLSSTPAESPRNGRIPAVSDPAHHLGQRSTQQSEPLPTQPHKYAVQQAVGSHSSQADHTNFQDSSEAWNPEFVQQLRANGMCEPPSRLHNGMTGREDTDPEGPDSVNMAPPMDVQQRMMNSLARRMRSEELQPPWVEGLHSEKEIELAVNLMTGAECYDVARQVWEVYERVCRRLNV